MQWAVQEKDMDFAIFLLENGADANIKYVDFCDSNDETLLHHVADKGYLKTVQDWVAQGANLNAVSSYNWTILHHAAQGGNKDLVKWLIEEKGMDKESLTSSQRTPLHIAANFGKLEVVKYLIEEAGMNPLRVAKSGKTPGMLAAEKKKTEILDYLRDWKREEMKKNHEEVDCLICYGEFYKEEKELSPICYGCFFITCGVCEVEQRTNYSARGCPGCRKPLV